MGKYEPLAQYLNDLPRDTWDASFEEIEQILKFDLPPSARKHISWWGNSRRGNHSQAQGWISAGWYVSQVDRKQGRVTLQRGEGEKTGTALQELWKKARNLSGITDRDELEIAAVSAYLRRLAADRLMQLGGTMPDFEPAPRDRPST